MKINRFQNNCNQKLFSSSDLGFFLSIFHPLQVWLRIQGCTNIRRPTWAPIYIWTQSIIFNFLFGEFCFVHGTSKRKILFDRKSIGGAVSHVENFSIQFGPTWEGDRWKKTARGYYPIVVLGKCSYVSWMCPRARVRTRWERWEKQTGLRPPLPPCTERKLVEGGRNLVVNFLNSLQNCCQFIVWLAQKVLF